MCLRTLVIISVISLVFGQDRKIISKLNPDCTACSENTTLVYIKADGSHDTIHQLWDFTRGTPTIIYAVAGLNSSLNIEWVNNKPIRFNMSEEPEYTFAMAVLDLYEYDDLRDSGQINFTDPYRTYPLEGLRWTRLDSVLTDQEAMLQMRVDRFRQGHHFVNGTIDIKFDLLPYRDYAAQLPHLIHTSNSTLFDIQLSSLSESRDYNSSRFALRLLLVADDSRGSMRRDIVKSLDDEHTPGVFEIIAAKTPRCAEQGRGGYLQYRPVAYTQRERSVTTSTIVHATDFRNVDIPAASTLYRFYRKSIENGTLLAQDMLVSFGEPGDGYYKQHNYTAWSSTVGYGSPPVETFSLLVVIVISLGLSVPVLLALSGVAFVLCRRWRRNAPTRLAEE